MSSLTSKIPPELRLRVYDYILTFDEPIGKASDLPKPPSNPNRSQIRPGSFHETEPLRSIRLGGVNVNVSILLACKQIYHEALPVLYRRNTICLPHDSCLTGGKLQNPYLVANATRLALLPPLEEQGEVQAEQLLESYYALQVKWPKLQNIMVRFECLETKERPNILLDLMSCVAASEASLPLLTMTSPGYCATTSDKRLRIEFEHQSVVSSWAWHRMLSSEQLRLKSRVSDLLESSLSLATTPCEMVVSMRACIMLYDMEKFQSDAFLDIFREEWPEFIHCSNKSHVLITWLLTAPVGNVSNS